MMQQRTPSAEEILSQLVLDDEKSRRRVSRQLNHWKKDHVDVAKAEAESLRSTLLDVEEGLKRTWTRIMMGQIDGKAACAELDEMIRHIHSTLDAGAKEEPASGS